MRKDSWIPLLGIVCICIGLLRNLTACEDIEVEPSLQSVQAEYTEFKLKADSKTGVIYIDNSIYTGTSANSGKTYHIYTPYYSKNGKLCRYEEGKIVEVEDANRN